jgi:Chitobiase/beta-hexosaminidase C-terminal domain
MSNSAFATATYTILVATPTFSPAPGSYSGSVRVTIATATAGATIRYTIDGTEPTTSSPQYTGTLTFTKTTILKAKAFKGGLSNSISASGTYTLLLQKTAAIAATQPIIPNGSPLLSKGTAITNRCVQYRSDLTGTVTAGQAQAGIKQTDSTRREAAIQLPRISVVDGSSSPVARRADRDRETPPGLHHEYSLSLAASGGTRRCALAMPPAPSHEVPTRLRLMVQTSPEPHPL